MSPALLPDSALGFVAPAQPGNYAFRPVADHCAQTGDPLVVDTRVGLTGAAGAAAASGFVVADDGQWRTLTATADVPTGIEEGATLDTLTSWSELMLGSTKAHAILTPSRFLTLGDVEARRSLLAVTADAPADVVTFLPTDADALGTDDLATLISDLRATKPRRFAFLFAAADKPLVSRPRLLGLRALMTAFPGSWVLGLDPLVATDVLAHGAGLAAVGASKGRRWPKPPGAHGGARVAAGWLPGLFLRQLLEMRSPSVYADWYANAPSPRCQVCGRPLDLFDPTNEDKAAIIRHNVHEISLFGRELASRDPADRRGWVIGQRLRAFDTHGPLSTAARDTTADETLRNLCTIDDRRGRVAVGAGRWR